MAYKMKTTSPKEYTIKLALRRLLAYALHTPLSTPLVLSYFLPGLFAAA